MVDRVFTMQDQKEFAYWTGDRNPLHLDPLWATSVYPGAVVVHGLHVVLWLIESWAPKIVGVSQVSVRFLRPVLLGDVVSAALEERPGGAVIQAKVLGKPVVRLEIDFGPEPAMKAALDKSERQPRANPRQRNLASMLGASGEVWIPSMALLSARFPQSSDRLGPLALAGLASLSPLVGMECPGLRSVFAEFRVTLNSGGSPMRYNVTNVDNRFSRVEMNISGYGVSGRVVASVLPNDDDCTSLPAVIGQVESNEFATSRPLVLGATSGLGAATALMLAAGGARPILGVHNSRLGEERVREQIASIGGSSQSIRFDVTNNADGLRALRELGWDGGSVFYFASPRIFRRRLQAFHETDWTDFEEIYVRGFSRTIRGLVEMNPQSSLAVLYPSSVAVESRPRDLLEYALAKQAGEGVCESIQREFSNVQILVVRFPRIDTRQTRSFLQADAADPGETLLPILRSFVNH